VAIDLEERTEIRTRIAAAEAVRAEHDVALAVRHERADLVGVFAHVVGRRDRGAGAVLEALRDVRRARLFLHRMQAIPALDVEAVAAQLREARARPDVADDAELLLEQLGRRDDFAQDRARAEQLHARNAVLLRFRRRGRACRAGGAVAARRRLWI